MGWEWNGSRWEVECSGGRKRVVVEWWKEGSRKQWGKGVGVKWLWLEGESRGERGGMEWG